MMSKAISLQDPSLLKFVRWLFIFCGLILAAFSISRSHEKIASASWPMTEAQIISSDIYQQSSRSDDWCLKLSYRYVVNGRTFSSRRLSTSLINNYGCDRERAVVSARLSKLKPGATVHVRYNPTDPAVAIVYVGRFDIFDYLFPVLALVLCLCGVAVVKAAAKTQQRGRSPCVGS